MSGDRGGTPAEWFPPERGPVLVIGNAGSVFTRHLAALWRSMGIDARIATRRWNGDRMVDAGIPVHVATDAESPARRRLYDGLEHLMFPFESALASMQHARYRRAMGSETSYQPFVTPGFADGLAIARFVRTLKAQFVLGQEAFSYGLATALCRNVPRVLMPWGGDVYMYAETTTAARAAVRYALTHVDLVTPGSPLAMDHLHRRLGVAKERMHVGGTWALDRDRFRPATAAGNAATRARFGIPADGLVAMNIRRFFPAWGSDLALNAFRRFAKAHAASHFVLLGGSGTEAFVASARAAIRSDGLSGRFTLFDGDLSLADCAALMSIADIVVSLMREQDMRPLASILEGVACGGAPILSDQPEYRAMEQQGFSATFCRVGDENAVLRALWQYADHDEERRRVSTQNSQYLDRHEDGRRQAVDLLRRVHAIRSAA